jgi:hypothetical protein
VRVPLPTRSEVSVIDDVTFDDSGVRRVSPEGGVEEVRWDDLTEVRIETTDEESFGEDVYWLLAGADGTAVAVAGSALTDDLRDRLQSLPGFDNEQMIRAMNSTDEAQFLCWQRDGRSGP